MGAGRRGAGLQAGPAVGHVVPPGRRAVEGDGAAVVGQSPAEDLDVGFGHRLWVGRGDRGSFLRKDRNAASSPGLGNPTDLL